MKILVERYEHGADYTLSKVYIDGELMCYGIEDQFNKDKIRGETRIPEGTYVVGKRYSPKFTPIYDHEMLWIKDVPGFEFILLHPGNTDDDTEGCLCVGTEPDYIKGQRAVLNSRAAYKRIYPIISAAIDRKENVTITYKSI